MKFHGSEEKAGLEKEVWESHALYVTESYRTG